MILLHKSELSKTHWIFKLKPKREAPYFHPVEISLNLILNPGESPVWAANLENVSLSYTF